MTLTTCPCGGYGIVKDQLDFSIAGKCTLCNGSGWIDENGPKTVEEKNQSKIDEYQDYFKWT